MKDYSSLVEAMSGATRRDFRELRDESPIVRFYAARTILDAAMSDNERVASTVAMHMDATAVTGVANDPDWKVRRAGQALIRAIARNISPIVDVRPDEDCSRTCHSIQDASQKIWAFARAQSRLNGTCQRNLMH